MCLILLAHAVHPAYRLVLAANRDEFFDRPTAPAAAWEDAPEIVGGRDLRAGGTWLGVTRVGRWAAITNHRDLSRHSPEARSRGELVAAFLRGHESPAACAAGLASRMHDYNGFNLLLGDGDAAWWISNRAPDRAGPLAPGIHGISNALLDTPWPKVSRGKRELEALLDPVMSPSPDELLHLLLDRTFAADHELPDTGVGPELERELSASFILTPGYGTRASTALLIHLDGAVDLVERTYTPGTTEWTEVHHRLQPAPSK
jgi:uncharacterized protein with NRDE domain